MIAATTKTYKITRAYLDGTQRGYTVGIIVRGRRVDLSHFEDSDEGYRAACGCQDSINKHGCWTGRKANSEWTVQIRGKTATFQKFD